MPSREAELVREILGYLRTHRHAAETAAGVHRWWLADASGWSLSEVNVALERLVREEILERHVLPGGEPLFRTRTTTPGPA
jgi:hypothetical protein